MTPTLRGRALAVQCDVTRTEDVKRALDKTIEAFGRLDFAFNGLCDQVEKFERTVSRIGMRIFFVGNDDAGVAHHLLGDVAVQIQFDTNRNIGTNNLTY